MREGEDESDKFDPIEEKATKKGVSPWEIVSLYEKDFFNDMDSLYMKRPTYISKASDHIEDMVSMIEKLIEKTFIQSGTLLQAIVSPVSNRSNVKGVISRGFTPEIM